MKKYDVIILGAGASGMFCAANIYDGLKVAVVDHNEVALSKVKISGGGRCNFTNENISHDNYVSKNNKFCISALKQFTSQDFIQIVKENDIEFSHKKLGQLFCVNKSGEIIKLLKKLCSNKDINFIYNSSIKKVSRNEDIFVVETSKGKLSAKNVVVATGGMSFVNLGATDIGYKIARDFGIKIVEPKPALVPLLLNEQERFDKLSGLSLNVKVRCENKEYKDDLLFTHFGLSGPAILKISSYWDHGKTIEIDFLPSRDIKKYFQDSKSKFPKKKLSTLLSVILPNKLVLHIMERHFKDIEIGNISDVKLENFASLIHNYKLTPNGTKGFAMAEVTKGGVDVNEISSKTFESKRISNLFFIGEVLDVAGDLGGYNLQWAWSSGYAASQNIY